MVSGITEMLFTMSCISWARFIGSLPASAISSCVLNFRKSTALFSRNATVSSALCVCEYESGSSPSGSDTTFMFMPSASSMSIPLMDACMPAASPSYSTVTLLVKRCISRICPVVSDVPDDATTFLMPDWCMDMTSM